MRIEAGRFKGRLLPRADGARPAGGRLRKSLFSVLAPRLPDARVLDLFAGVGALGLEALSRGARTVVLVDRDGRAVGRLARWIQEAGAEAAARTIRCDALTARLPAGPFDLIFLDPPFALWDGAQAVGLLARALDLLDPGGWLVVKLPARRDLPADRRWQVRSCRAVGDAQWAIVVGEAGASSPAPPAPMEKEAGPDPGPPDPV